MFESENNPAGGLDEGDSPLKERVIMLGLLDGSGRLVHVTEKGRALGLKFGMYPSAIRVQVSPEMGSQLLKVVMVPNRPLF
jgi:hypothetical protein